MVIAMALSLPPTGKLYTWIVKFVDRQRRPRRALEVSILLTMVSMCVSLPNSCVEMLTPKMMALRGEAFGKLLGYEDGTLMIGISAS